MPDVDRGYSTTGPIAPAPIPPLESLMARATAPTPDPTAALIATRRETHGDFTVHAKITQGLKAQFYAVASRDRFTPVQQEALDMIFHKIGRIGAGNPGFADHWDDIAGYARLVSERLEK